MSDELTKGTKEPDPTRDMGEADEWVEDLGVVERRGRCRKVEIVEGKDKKVGDEQNKSNERH